ncbi:MAG: transposase [archaeon]
MGNNKKRSAKEKLKIVLEGLKSDNISETCREHGIYESQFYQWKNKLLDSADKVYSRKNKKDPEKEKLKSENEKLKETIVEQTCELQILKKNDK